jgi:hypothetical protein
MNELTDLEICKRIAEIEGIELFNSYSIIFDKKALINMYMDKGTKWHHAAENEECFFTKVYTNPSQYHKAIYNPLTDDALCLQLIDKYNVSINTHFWNPSVKQCYIIRQVNFEMLTGKTFSINDLGLKKAACLAIIESK